MQKQNEVRDTLDSVKHKKTSRWDKTQQTTKSFSGNRIEKHKALESESQECGYEVSEMRYPCVFSSVMVLLFEVGSELNFIQRRKDAIAGGLKRCKAIDDTDGES
jgi:hypothetical protein